MVGPGLINGRYEVGPALGRGGMGAVYEARDRVFGRDVALKVLTFESPEAIEVFRREFALLSSAAHPHLPRAFDFGRGRWGGREIHFSTAELVRGLRDERVAGLVGDALLRHVLDDDHGGAGIFAAHGADAVAEHADGGYAGGGAAAAGRLPAVASGHPEIDAVCQIQTFYAMLVQLARLRGSDADNPRHLKKVTRTR